jgi:hypothetical protein
VYDEAASTEDPNEQQHYDPYNSPYDPYYSNENKSPQQQQQQQSVDASVYQNYYDNNQYSTGRKIEDLINFRKIENSFGKFWSKAKDAISRLAFEMF